jgi:hypothetical protein
MLGSHRGRRAQQQQRLLACRSVNCGHGASTYGCVHSASSKKEMNVNVNEDITYTPNLWFFWFFIFFSLLFFGFLAYF